MMKQQKSKPKVLSRQQKETRIFFHKQAEDWDAKAKGKHGIPWVNVIKERNKYSLFVVKHRKKTITAFDVGCGVGDLAVALAKKGIKTVGIDFASAMIEIGKRRTGRNPLVELSAENYFDFRTGPGIYDLIVGNGFIEYLSYQERDIFLARSFKELRKGGSLVISSRNRLFNIFSSNTYTKQELAEGNVVGLAKENIAWSEGMEIDEAKKFEAAEVNQQDIKHGDTGVKVGTRYQYTPAQLVQISGKHGFRVKALSPIHIHGMVPAMKIKQPALHKAIADKLHKVAVEQTLFLPQASAFMLHAVKPD